MAHARSAQANFAARAGGLTASATIGRVGLSIRADTAATDFSRATRLVAASAVLTVAPEILTDPTTVRQVRGAGLAGVNDRTTNVLTLHASLSVSRR